MRMKSLAAAIATALLATTANAQLQVTEIMYNPLTNDGEFEWFEIVNTSGAAIDLDGYYLEDDGGFVREDFLPNISNVSSGGQAMNTVINAGQVAVLYDGFGTYNYDDALFRSTWNIPASAAVIPVDFFPSLNQDGDTIGFWVDQTQVALDADGPLASPGANIATFNNTFYNFTYGVGTDWPIDTEGVSIELVGADETVPGNWRQSVLGENDASLSNAILADGSGFINSTDDFGSPGDIQTVGTPPVGELIISEIMYNPRSSEDDWEWVEVYNNTGAAIDFSVTNYVFDDDDNADFAAANVTSGVIPDGQAGVLFNAEDITAAQMEAAWGTTNGLGQTINYIPVTEWTSLTNGSGDGVALWSSFGDYTTETTTGQGRSFDNAVASVTYRNNSEGWPDDDGQSSIFLEDLTNAGATTLTEEVGDFNGDGSVDAADYTIWRDTEGSLVDFRADADGDFDVDADDYQLWVDNFGAVAVLSNGPFWVRSGLSTGLDFDSRSATGVLPDGLLFDYDGGGIGSPGFFTAPGPATAVPEPTAAVLALLAFAGLATRRS